MGTGPDEYQHSLVDRALVRLRLLSPLPVVRRRADGSILLPTGNTAPAGTPQPRDRQKIQPRP